MPSPCWPRKKAKGGGRRGPQALKELGQDADGNTIKVLKGRYGPYVSDGETNATIPESHDPAGTGDPGTGAGADRRAHRQGRRQEEEKRPAAKTKAGAQSRKRKPAKPAKKTAPKKKEAAKKKPEPVAGE